jgi:hypothetical protein
LNAPARGRSWARRALVRVDANPSVTLWLPPALFLVQFLLLIALVRLGFPDHTGPAVLPVNLLLVALFGLVFLCFFGMALGVRQAFRLQAKAMPIAGILLNGGYLVGFSLFFLFVVVLRNLT